jgi:hypothetical protein
VGNTRLLQQVSLNVCTVDVADGVELNSDEFTLTSVKTVVKLTKREELWFRIVWALPKDSKMGLACKI